MSLLPLFGILLSVTTLAFVAGYKLAFRAAQRDLSSKVAAAAKAASELALDGSAELLREVTEQLQRTLAERNDFERRAEENRKTIETVLKERDGWIELYDKQSIGHGNAQAIMMDAIGYLEAQLSAAGVTVELPGIVRQTQDQYLMAHVLPAVKRSGSTVIHRGEPEPNSAPASGKGASSV